MIFFLPEVLHIFYGFIPWEKINDLWWKINDLLGKKYQQE